MEKLCLKKYKNDQYEFAHNRLEVLFIKYIVIVGAIGWAIILIFDIFHGRSEGLSGYRYPITSLQYALPIFIILGTLHWILYLKQACKIIFMENEITIFLYKSKNPVIYKLNELKTLKISFFYIFEFEDGKTIWFNDYKSKEYMDFLKENKFPIKYGKFRMYRFNL